MTTTPMATTTDRLLDALAGGQGVPVDLFAPDAVLDATVPTWRFPTRGAEAVAAKLSAWYDAPGTFSELERLPVEGGEVLTYAFSSTDDNGPYTVHHCQVLRFDAEGRIAQDRFWCGGRWDAERMAEMAAADDAG